LGGLAHASEKTMADETQVETPIDGAPVSPADTVTESPPVEAAESSKPDTDKELSKRVQDRIDELTREKYDRAREAEYWRNIAQHVQQAQQPKSEPQAVESLRLPTLEEFDYDTAKFYAAMESYVEHKAGQVVETRLSREDAQRKEIEQLKTFASRSQEFAKANPDYVEKVMRAPTLPISVEVQSVLRGLDDGPEIAYHLATHAEDAYRLMDMPTPLAMLEVGRIQGRLMAIKEAARRPPPVSKAPPPPPILESAESSSPKAPEDMSDAEWYRAEKRKQNLKQFQKKA
jgi:hypothetical protein